MRVAKLSTARNVAVLLIASSDHLSGLAGATLAITASKDGAAFASITPTVTDLGSGWYNLALTTTHTNTAGDLALHITAASADPQDMLVQVVAYDMTDAVRLGLTALPNAAAGGAAGLPLGDASGRVDLGKWLGTTVTLSSGVPDVNIKTITAGIIAAGSFAANALDAVWSTAARTLTAFAFSVTVGTNSDKTGYTLSGAGVQAIWDALTSALTTVGSVGKRIADFLTGDAFVRLGAPAGASTSADIAAVKTDTAAVKVQTDKLAFTVANQVDSNVLDWKGATAPAMTGDAFARLGAPAGASTAADIAATKALLPTALVGGRMDSSLGALANGIITALSIAPGAFDSAAFTTAAEQAFADRLLARNIAGGSDGGVTVFSMLAAMGMDFTVVAGVLTVKSPIDGTTVVYTRTLSRTAGLDAITGAA